MQINIIYGTKPFEMTTQLLRVIGFEKQLKSDSDVVIKPNLVVSKPANSGATTHPEIVEAIVCFLRDCGVKAVTIAEGSWLGDQTERAFKICGYDSIAKKYGVKLFDTKSDVVLKKNFRDLSLGVCERVAKADVLINVPVLKGHCQTEITCCLKNMKGCIPDSEKRRYHNIGLHKPIAALNTVLKPTLHVVDGICGDPTFEEGGNPVEANRILVGTDPVTLDSYCAGLIGLDSNRVEYIRLAQEYGVGKFCDENVKVIEHETQSRPACVLQNQSSLIRQFEKHIEAQNACSACYAALICALNRSNAKYRAVAVAGKIKIGQGFRGQKCAGFGVGNCTNGCDNYVPGCPPTASEIMRGIKNNR
ncbi:MAG: DUF362 domain-containing protein [Thermoguttaceae bacterium]